MKTKKICNETERGERVRERKKREKETENVTARN